MAVLIHSCVFSATHKSFIFIHFNVNTPLDMTWLYQPSSFLGLKHVYSQRGLNSIVTTRFLNTEMFYREGNHPDDYSRVTYRKLLDLVCQFGNALRDCGVGRGDRVGIYMPMILETVIAMLACARIGAVHTVVVNILLSLFQLRTVP